MKSEGEKNIEEDELKEALRIISGKMTKYSASALALIAVLLESRAGVISVQPPRLELTSGYYTWGGLNKEEMKALLPQLIPHLRIKKELAELLLKSLNIGEITEEDEQIIANMPEVIEKRRMKLLLEFQNRIRRKKPFLRIR